MKPNTYHAILEREVHKNIHTRYGTKPEVRLSQLHRKLFMKEAKPTKISLVGSIISKCRKLWRLYKNEQK